MFCSDVVWHHWYHHRWNVEQRQQWKWLHFCNISNDADIYSVSFKVKYASTGRLISNTNTNKIANTHTRAQEVIFNRAHWTDHRTPQLIWLANSPRFIKTLYRLREIMKWTKSTMTLRIKQSKAKQKQKQMEKQKTTTLWCNYMANIDVFSCIH